ncbi:MAG: hypothetical protein MZV63_37485 [Marinilabiliales bacterium]|nr:hypothetical protein [Marinilabiliales bacterium]
MRDELGFGEHKHTYKEDAAVHHHPVHLTGDIPEAGAGHYVKGIIPYNIDDNALVCGGPLKASSESLSALPPSTLADPGTQCRYSRTPTISGRS